MNKDPNTGVVGMKFNHTKPKVRRGYDFRLNDPLELQILADALTRDPDYQNFLSFQRGQVLRLIIGKLDKATLGDSGPITPDKEEVTNRWRHKDYDPEEDDISLEEIDIDKEKIKPKKNEPPEDLLSEI